MTAPVTAQTAMPALDRQTMLARLEEELRRPAFHAFLRPESKDIDVSSGTLTICMAYRPEFGMDPEADIYHGGVISSLIDLACHAAVAVQLGHRTPTIDLRVDFLRPVPGVDLLARAWPVRIGRRISRADVEIYAEGRIVAMGRGTFSSTDM